VHQFGNYCIVSIEYRVARGLLTLDRMVANCRRVSWRVLGRQTSDRENNTMYSDPC